jgi:hypothetical protein
MMAKKKSVAVKKRQGVIERKTTETKISLKLVVEGSGRYKVKTGIRFFDHMLELFTRHGAFDLELQCDGDLDVDQHHTVEDVGIALGEAFDQALGDKKGILRAGYFLMPMDETLGVAAVDLSGRVSCVVKTKVKKRLVGEGRGPTCTSQPCMGAPTITRSRRCSRRSRGRCELRAPRISNWERCCPAPKDCCDRGH